MKKAIYSLLLTLTAAAGCHAQLPPTSHAVVLTWTAPAASGGWTGCTVAAPCTYVISREVVPAGTASCPPAPSVAPFPYTPLNSANPASALTYSDTTAAGQTVCYIAQTIQGAASSAPSTPTAPLVVPASPAAPSLTPNVAVNQPSLPVPTLPVQGPILTASLGREVR